MAFWAKLWIVLVFALSTFAVDQAHACGRGTDCKVASGDYRVYIPKDLPKGRKAPAIVYIHGLMGSSERTIANSSFRRMAKKNGAILIAVNGRAGSWSFPNGVVRGKKRNEFTYFREVVADVKRRFPIDPNRIVAAGFSIGASMTWYLACRQATSFAGFITVAGTMWRPQPQSCSFDIGHLHHTHGTSDRTFPLTGRVVAGKRQGDIRDTFEMVYRQDRCTNTIEREVRINGQRCKFHKNCDGEPISFCLHGGGHSVRAAYLDSGFKRIARARGW